MRNTVGKLMEAFIQKINQLLDEHFLIMLEQKSGKIYLLKEHWRYLNWKKHSPRVLIGEGQLNKENYVYLTHKISTLRRTKF